MAYQHISHQHHIKHNWYVVSYLFFIFYFFFAYKYDDIICTIVMSKQFERRHPGFRDPDLKKKIERYFAVFWYYGTILGILNSEKYRFLCKFKFPGKFRFSGLSFPGIQNMKYRTGITKILVFRIICIYSLLLPLYIREYRCVLFGINLL